MVDIGASQTPPRVPFFIHLTRRLTRPAVSPLSRREVNALALVLNHPPTRADGEVVDMCAKHTPFYNAGAYDSPRAKLIIGDAKAGLEACDEGSIDVIICDLSDPLDGGPCYQLYTTSFYEMCKSKLAPGHPRDPVGVRRCSRLQGGFHPDQQDAQGGVPPGVGLHRVRALLLLRVGFQHRHEGCGPRGPLHRHHRERGARQATRGEGTRRPLLLRRHHPHARCSR